MNTARIEELLRMFNENAPIARYFGMKLSFTDEANPVLSSPPGPWALYPLSLGQRTKGLSCRTSAQGPRAGQCAVIDLPYNPNLDHALDGIHGGVYATMLDSAGWFTAAAAHDISCWMATSEMSVHFLLPARHTSLRAIGRLLKQGKRQDIAEMYLYDGQGRWIGHGVGTFVVLPDVPLSPTP